MFGCKCVRADFYKLPFSKFVVKATQPIVGPLRRVIPAIAWPMSVSVVVAFVLALAVRLSVCGQPPTANFVVLRSYPWGYFIINSRR
ncbi:YggT family protein [Providencia hangzhouensis]|uniref:YggT family protein n=1 Tax=Providencia hangzhouensis TaxID=3031799 RepID=UPI003F6939F4